jgi:preprotein translocase SecE subunit
MKFTKKPKKEKRIKTKEDKVPFKLKRWVFGLQKEFKRISWAPRNTVIKDFFIIIIIVLLFAGIFFGID